MTAVSLRHSPPGLNLNKLNKPEQPSPETEQPPKGALNYKGPELVFEQGVEEVSEEQRPESSVDDQRPASVTVQVPHDEEPVPETTGHMRPDIEQAISEARRAVDDRHRQIRDGNQLYYMATGLLAARVGRTSVNLLAS